MALSTLPDNLEISVLQTQISLVALCFVYVYIAAPNSELDAQQILLFRHSTGLRTVFRFENVRFRENNVSLRFVKD